MKIILVITIIFMGSFLERLERESSKLLWGLIFIFLLVFTSVNKYCVIYNHSISPSYTQQIQTPVPSGKKDIMLGIISEDNLHIPSFPITQTRLDRLEASNYWRGTSTRFYWVSLTKRRASKVKRTTEAAIKEEQEAKAVRKKARANRKRLLKRDPMTREIYKELIKASEGLLECLLY